MTGAELIIYILENGLEREQITDNGRFLNFLTADEAAVKFGVGLATIETWYGYGWIKGLKIGNTLYISQNATFNIDKKA